MQNNKLNVIIVGGIIILALYSTFTMFSKIDNKVMERGTSYDQCVIELYGVTPSEYLSMKGVMPECEPVTASSTVEVCHSLSYYTDHKIPARDISNKCFNEIYSFN